jgi:methyl-accepting chemotaxis protein
LNELDGWIEDEIMKAPKPESSKNLSSRIDPEASLIGRSITDNVVQSLGDAKASTERAVLVIGEQISALLEIAKSSSEVAANSLCGIVGKEQLEESSCAEQSDDGSITELLGNQRDSISLFVDKTHQFFRQQSQLAQKSRSRFKKVESCISKIDSMVNGSWILSMNAQIEAARLGDKGHAFSVVVDEMKAFSVEIREANASINEVVKSVSRTMEQFRKGASEIEAELSRFSNNLQEDVAKVETCTKDLTVSLSSTLNQITANNDLLIKHSRIALSELQFQDPLAQGLMRNAFEVLKLQSLIETGKCEDIKASDIDPTVGQDGSNDRPTGEVELF